MLIVVIYIIPEGRAAGSFRFLNLHHYMGITLVNACVHRPNSQRAQIKLAEVWKNAFSNILNRFYYICKKIRIII